VTALLPVVTGEALAGEVLPALQDLAAPGWVDVQVHRAIAETMHGLAGHRGPVEACVCANTSRPLAAAATRARMGFWSVRSTETSVCSCGHDLESSHGDAGPLPCVVPGCVCRRFVMVERRWLQERTRTERVGGEL
jgi:hypothetical protein